MLDLSQTASKMALQQVLFIVLASCIVSQAIAADWGLNGTIAVTNATQFATTQQTERATHVHASKFLLDQNMWVMSYYVPGAAAIDRYRLKLWQIVLGDSRTLVESFLSSLFMLL
jgi:hypothetical protein